MSKALVFKEREVIPFDNGDGKIWFTAETLADLLGYTNSNKVLNLYKRHKDEFTESMTTLTKVRMNGINNSLREVSARLFSLRGAHLIGMLSRTKVAKALRRWLLDLADKENNAYIPSVGYTIQQMQNIVAKARKASDEDSSDAGRRLRKRQDDLMTLDKAERLIDDLGQMALGLVGGGKKEIAHI
ncbi:BRO family protein [Xenorhabdus sp. XENO-10]|uniref:BRO family protein n=1 Tax=Xenorhabdus yunnanensis TaxID=3025878 RepID=A0ABT5LL88_9GAMM|nr:BRO family protein [Xenorhabdus yunnanensis]MDC9591729.1 BRO family protein [Xenorhabdus yunnanensis]